MSRRHDARRALPHRNYTVQELAVLFNVGLPTVSRWCSEGLERVDAKRPYLFTGSMVRRFLEAKNKPRQPLQPGEFYCLRCKVPVSPQDAQCAYHPRSATHGDLKGHCQACATPLLRTVKKTEITEKAGKVIVRNVDDTNIVSKCRQPPHTEA